ncbi:MAG TPA: AsmA-like C-terminal region-containing protein [Burkholderiales bacterium]|nr:AsmA-like C-terminal region-containing protein [Burkholderiales bacterium]
MATLVPQTVFTKTAKGILEIRNKSTRLPRDLAQVLEFVDGTASIADLQARSSLPQPQFHNALNTLAGDGYIKAVASSANAHPAVDPSAVQFDSPAVDAKLSMEIATHALASAEAAKVAQQEGHAALESRLRAEAEARARALAETRLNAEAEARATAEAAARAAQHARDHAEQVAAAASDPAAKAQAQTEARTAATAALRARAEAQSHAEAEERARAVVEEKKAAEQREREEAQKHAEAERRAQERAGAEQRARDALQAQLDASAAARGHDDPETRALLHQREAAAERAREDAELVAQSQGVAAPEATENLHFDDLAQKLTARVNAERRAREEASRRTTVAPAATAAGPAAPAPAAGDVGRDGFPPLEFVPGNAHAEPEAEPAAAAAEAHDLPSIDMRAGSGRGDIRHTTPEHVPSALERAMMERQARTETEARSDDGAAAAPAPGPAPTAASSSAAAPRSMITRSGGTATIRAAPPSFEAKRELAPHEETAAEEKVEPTLEEDEPAVERLNVDRSAHDVLAQNAEEQRKREAEALSRQAADMRRQRQQEEVRRAAYAERERKRRALGRGVTIAAIGIPVAVVAWLQFVPLNGYVPDVQQALSARLNQPSTVSTVRYVLLPTPRIVLEGVRIGSAQAVHIERIDAHAWPTSLFTGPHDFSAVDARGVTLDPGILATIPAWTGGRSANTVHVEKLRLYDVKLGLADRKTESVNGEVAFAPNGTVKDAVFDSDKIRLELIPLQTGVRVALNARDWRAPFGPAAPFSYLTLEGIADKDRFATTQLSGRVGGGLVEGTFAARWDGPTTVGGELTIKGTRIEEVLPQLAPGFRAKGLLNANLRYAMQADTASGLMEKATVEGTFALARGEIGGVDLARLVQLPGTPAGGRTAFDEIKGSVQMSGNRYSYRNVQLTSGPLEATGHIDVAGGQLSGRVDAQMTSRSAIVARSIFAVRGTVKEPQLSR